MVTCGAGYPLQHKCNKQTNLVVCVHVILVEETFVLVYWPEEECVSVVAGPRVSGDHQVGGMCAVSIRRKAYFGKVAATGKYVDIHCRCTVHVL